ncbi:acyl-CoA dehydrogenase family protein [Auritidibacter ignavus]|uniref:acyl-CoA dehydrogenase family protein n=1 Tax=Auritidibacter ignavus TaxID=678932 RepID=UPI00244796D6|nr:acyl-CoA dehydrogenase family protein [Auritidibacter ignavus]WGH87269.1 acyl-CoA/acyl-ACP dehydrogenase [Auritidibacter ignavus]WGH89557.1 acyl-CoA/acyl-ACP dehydrogenase [Auritidibacter ignavus]
MTAPSRDYDLNSVIDQILSGHVPDPDQPHTRTELSPEEAHFVASITDWCSRQDVAERIESTAQVPDDLLEDLAQLGAFRITIPTRYGGLGFSDTCLLAVLSVLTSAHASLCEVIAAHQVIGAVRPLLEFGTEAQRDRYLPQLTEQVSAFALNEPELGYGSGPLQTTASFDVEAGTYRVTGTKTWITNATIASHMIVLVDVAAGEDSPGGITALLITADDPGVTRGLQSRFAGMHGLPNGRLAFDDACIPADRVIGGEGNGVEVALTCLSQCRAALPVAGLTTILACLQQAVAWAGEDRQTRRGLHTHPQTQHHLSTLMVEALIANAVTWHALDEHCAPTDSEAAKLIVSEAANRATDTVMQLVGGRGYETAASARAREATPWPIERLWRDTRVTRIFDSSTEMLKDLLAQPPSTTPTTVPPTATGGIAEQVSRLHHAIGSEPDDPWVRASAVDCALELFTLACLHQYRRNLGEDDRSATTAWETAVDTLDQRIDAHLQKLSNPSSLQRQQTLATELLNIPQAGLPVEFTRPLNDLGARR